MLTRLSLAAAVLVLGVGGASIDMAPGSRLEVTCPNALTVHDVTPHSLVLHCARTTTTT